MLMRKNPGLTELVDQGAFDQTDLYNIAENDFMMAVGFKS